MRAPCASWNATSLLNVIDRKWREHLYEMDYLKEGIGLRAMAQRDLLVEYQREGYDMFVGHARRPQRGVGRLPVQRSGRGRPGRPQRQVAPVAAPSGLAEFAAAAAAKAGESTAADPESGAVATKERPAPALRAKGIDNEAPPLTYTGPSEDGNAEVQRSGSGGRHSASSGGTRRERREAARKQAKTGRPAKSHRKN